MTSSCNRVKVLQTGWFQTKEMYSRSRGAKSKAKVPVRPRSLQVGEKCSFLPPPGFVSTRWHLSRPSFQIRSHARVRGEHGLGGHFSTQHSSHAACHTGSKSSSSSSERGPRPRAPPGGDEPRALVSSAVHSPPTVLQPGSTDWIKVHLLEADENQELLP